MKELQAFWAGLKDGWRQPHELASTTNMEPLATRRWGSDAWVDEMWILLEAVDKGASIGQFLRAGFKSQSWREKCWPFEKESVK